MTNPILSIGPKEEDLALDCFANSSSKGFAGRCDGSIESVAAKLQVDRVYLYYREYYDASVKDAHAARRANESIRRG